MRRAVLILFVAQLSGCCSGLRTAVRAYGAEAESSAEVTAELVKRCRAAASDTDAATRDQDLAACDQAQKSLANQKSAAAELKTIH